MKRDLGWLLGLCALLLSPTAGAQVLKCVDAEGNVTYSDLPCLRSERATVVDTRAASNVADHSFVRAQKGRFETPPAPSVIYSSSAPPVAPPPESNFRNASQSGRGYTRY
jgi:hypothetical protein